MSTSEGKCVLVEVGALISWSIYSYRIVMLLVPYMWASMTFLPMQSLMDHKALVVLTHWSFSWDVHVKQVFK